MHHPGRNRHWLGTVPRKRWGLVVEEIGGQIAVLNISHAGSLAKRLDALER